MAVYYNENDPFAAEWLRQLILAKCIPDGFVDQRSILNVRATELEGYDQCHFFAGIGGWPYALSLAGWPKGQKVWTGSCPCQPFSNAGQRFGVCDERHLWPVWKFLIEKCRPPVIFGEQVASKAGRYWFAGIRAEMEEISYAVGAASLSAAGYGARHRRQRIYFVAHASGTRLQGFIKKGKGLRCIHEEAPTECGDNSISSRVFSNPNPKIIGALNGVPRPVGIVRGFGNAIVPQVAAKFIQEAVAAIGLT